MTTAPHRFIHAPGTLPEGTDMEWLRENTREFTLHTLPDDMDKEWLADYVRRLREYALEDEDNPVRVIKDGMFRHYEDVPVLRPEKGRLRFWMQALVDVQRVEHNDYLVAKYAANLEKWPTTPLQLSRPFFVDAALFTLVGKLSTKRLRHKIAGIFYALINMNRFRIASHSELRASHDRAQRLGVAHRIKYSLEAPSVLYALNLPLGPLRPLVRRWLAYKLLQALADIPNGQAVLHLCMGRLGKLAILHPLTLKELVNFLNLFGPLLDKHGIRRPPVQVPVAYGGIVRTDDEYYEDLTRLAPGWTIIAGVVVPHLPVDSEASLRKFERALGRVVSGVSTSCGWADCSIAEVLRVFEIFSRLHRQMPDDGVSHTA